MTSRRAISRLGSLLAIIALAACTESTGPNASADFDADGRVRSGNEQPEDGRGSQRGWGGSEEY